MISREILEKLARQYQTSVFPNVIREYFQHLFLSELYRLPESERLLFKGGTALRIIYGSPRFSEDLDFSLSGGPRGTAAAFIEGLFLRVLAQIEKIGIDVELNEKSGATSGGYFGAATLKLLDYQPVRAQINVSSRGAREVHGEVDSVTNDFVPTYTLTHLSQEELVEEKVFGALVERKKPRDFYDLYFMMRKRMLSAAQKRKLAKVKERIVADAQKINLKAELRAFLPTDQQAIIRDFLRALEAELERQII